MPATARSSPACACCSERPPRSPSPCAPFPSASGSTGSSAAEAYFGAAVLFAVAGAAILILVGATYRESDAARSGRCQAVSRPRCSSLARNRAFVALNAAMMAMIVAITVLNKSVLYYFKYLLNDPHAGAACARVDGAGRAAIAIPLWMLLGRYVGLRALWLIAAGLGMAGLLILFAAVRFDGARRPCRSSWSACR